MHLIPVINVSQDMQPLNAELTSPSIEGNREFENVLSKHSADKMRPAKNTREEKRLSNSASQDHIEQRHNSNNNEHDGRKDIKQHADIQHNMDSADAHNREKVHEKKHSEHVKAGSEAESYADKLTTLMMLMGVLAQQSQQSTGDAQKASELLLSGFFETGEGGKGSALEELFGKIKELLEGAGDNGNTVKLKKEIDSLFATLLSSSDSASVKEGNFITLPNGNDLSDKDNVTTNIFAPDDNDQKLSTHLNKEAATETKKTAFPLKSENISSEDQSAQNGISFKQVSDKTDVNRFAAENVKIQAQTPSINETKKFDENITQTASPKDDSIKMTPDSKSKAGEEILSGFKSAKEFNIPQSHTKGDLNALKNIHNAHKNSIHDVSPRLTINSNQTGDKNQDLTKEQHRSAALIIDFRTNAESCTSENSFSNQAQFTASTNTDPASALSNSGGFNSMHAKVDESVTINSTNNNLRSSMMEQVRDGITRTVALNRNRAVIHLNPPELGSVTIRISVNHNNHVQASFMTEHAHTNQLLQSGMETLKTQLAQNGFDLGQVNINLSDSGMNNAHTFHRDQSQNGNSRFSRDFNDDTIDTMSEIPTTGQIVPDHGGRMHIIL